MKHTINLIKMESTYSIPVTYHLHSGEVRININNFLGEKISINYLHQINCIRCGRLTKTSFAQGYCYPCFINAPETEECVLRPELCLAHEGIARDMEFASSHCLIDHFVYLSVTGSIKVGVTRHTQIPVRWIDQGAKKSIILARTPNRYIAGSIEVALKNIFPDKTNWRDMLINKQKEVFNLLEEKKRAIDFLHPDFRKYASTDNEITEFSYPVEKYPEKVKSINLDTTPEITDVLTGIKGQYLIFQSGKVFNVRKHGGYLVSIDLPD